MWNPLGIFGSRVVEAISAAPVESLATVAPVALASAAAAPVAPAPAAAPMEGQDANSLIATRLGVEPGDVTAKLVALSQQNELDGAANGTVNVSLTLDDLEEFERQEEATAASKLTLKMRPAVLGATPTRTTPAPAAPAAAAATPLVVSPAVVKEVVHMASPPPPPAAPAPAPAVPWSEDYDEGEMMPEEDTAPTTAADATEAKVVEVVEPKDADAWPERKRYAEAVEAEEILMGIAQIEAPLLERDDLTLADLQHVVVDVVSQVNKSSVFTSEQGAHGSCDCGPRDCGAEP
jgi:hypothetical protein